MRGLRLTAQTGGCYHLFLASVGPAAGPGPGLVATVSVGGVRSLGWVGPEVLGAVGCKWFAQMVEFCAQRAGPHAGPRAWLSPRGLFVV